MDDSRLSLIDLLNHYNTDKEKYHHYGATYSHYLDPIRDYATSILEIGVWNGESLRVWRDFFPNAQIHGIDINSQCTQHTELNINIHIGDQADSTFLVNIGFKHGPFDLVIDDGSHQISHQLLSLLYLWQFLKPNGLYIIEDIQDPGYYEIFRLLRGKVHDLRGNRDDVLAVLQRGNVNYGFKCPEEGCGNKAHFSIMTPMNARSKCPKHQVHYIPDIDWPPGVKVEEVDIDPKWAAELLEDAFQSSFEGVDEPTVQRYADLMYTGQWIFITKEMGGEHYPIYLRDDKVLLGIQRLQACVRSNTPFQSVMVRTYGYY